MTTPFNENLYDPEVHLRLIARFHSSATEPDSERWLLLEAAHIVGQTRFASHLQVHCLMLALAWEKRMVKESLGQLFRIVLVPLGHLLGRLPLGNSGRAEVSAFKTMAPSTELLQIIAEASPNAPGGVPISMFHR